MSRRISKLYRDFIDDERGLALTEYLILLGLVTGSVLVAILIIGATIDGVWSTWVSWFGNGDLNPPS